MLCDREQPLLFRHLGYTPREIPESPGPSYAGFRQCVLQYCSPMGIYYVEDISIIENEKFGQIFASSPLPRTLSSAKLDTPPPSMPMSNLAWKGYGCRLPPRSKAVRQFAALRPSFRASACKTDRSAARGHSHTIAADWRQCLRGASLQRVLPHLAGEVLGLWRVGG